MKRFLPLVCLLCVPLAAQANEKKKDKLYDRLGGTKGVAKIVDDLFKFVVAKDSKVREVHKKHFMEGDVDGLKKKLRDQIGEATGGPEKYKGKDMKAAHKGMGITNADFDALADCVRRALDANSVSAADRATILGVLNSMRKDVVEKK
jgi:hemoglobin